MTMLIPIYGTETRKELNDIAFSMMATAHPHETYAEWPERFLAYVKTQAPDLTKADVERILAETAATNPEQ